MQPLSESIPVGLCGDNHGGIPRAESGTDEPAQLVEEKCVISVKLYPVCVRAGLAPILSLQECCVGITRAGGYCHSGPLDNISQALHSHSAQYMPTYLCLDILHHIYIDLACGRPLQAHSNSSLQVSKNALVAVQFTCKVCYTLRNNNGRSATAEPSFVRPTTIRRTFTWVL